MTVVSAAADETLRFWEIMGQPQGREAGREGGREEKPGGCWACHIRSLHFFMSLFIIHVFIDLSFPPSFPQTSKSNSSEKASCFLLSTPSAWLAPHLGHLVESDKGGRREGGKEGAKEGGKEGGRAKEQVCNYLWKCMFV